MTIEEINQLPKVELHLHLDGSVSLELASKLLNVSIIELKDKMIAKNKCKDLSEYLTKFSLPISLMQTKENLILIAKDLVDSLAKENVIYAEIRFAPQFHTQNGLTYKEIVSAVLLGLNSNPYIKVNLILCLMRGANEKNNLETIKVAKQFLNKGVCAIDLAGDEKLYPTSDYAHYFKLANKNNIPYTIHAGESRDASEVDIAINLGAKRIGHGIHCIESQNTLKLIKEKNILLEICPTSNIQTNAIDTYNNHPIRELYNMNIPLNINTDNRTVSNITINQEYLKLHDIFNFQKVDFNKINIDAINHAFLSNKEKEQLLKTFNIQ